MRILLKQNLAQVRKRLERVLPTELFTSIDNLPRKDRDALYLILYKNNSIIKWPKEVDESSQQFLNDYYEEPIGMEEIRTRKTKRMFELFGSDRSDLENWCNQNSDDLMQVTPKLILITIFKRELKQPYKKIAIIGGYKTARSLAKLLKRRYKISTKEFCEVFIQKNDKAFRLIGLSQKN